MTVITKFAFRDGYRTPKGLKADDAAKALEDVRGACGVLTAENVVNAARAKDNPLHKAFEWNDGKAAEQYRLQQANSLIRCVVIIEEKQEPFRYFTLAAPGEGEKATYLPTTMLVQKPDLLQDGLARLRRELAGYINSVEELMRVAKDNATATKKLTQAHKSMQKAKDVLG